MRKILILTAICLCSLGLYLTTREPAAETIEDEAVVREAGPAAPMATPAIKAPISSPAAKPREEPASLTTNAPSPEVLEKRKEAGEGYSETRTGTVPIDETNPLVYQGDILIDQKRVKWKKNKEEVELAPVDYWTTGVIPFKIKGLPQDTVRGALLKISESTRWKFVPQTDETDFVIINIGSIEGCQSYLGKKGGIQFIELGGSCTEGKILHELMHAIGFVHEQSREDRDEYLQVLWENIDPLKKDQFVKLPALISQPVEAPFDFDSILLYPSQAFTADEKSSSLLRKDGTPFPANRGDLSVLDIKKANLLFEAKVTDDQTGKYVEE